MWLIANKLHYFASLQNFIPSCFGNWWVSGSLGIDEKKKAGKSHWEAQDGKLVFFLFKKNKIYWVLLNNLAKVKSLLCKVVLQNSLMKLFFIPFWMLPTFDVCKCRCRLWVLISLSFSFFMPIHELVMCCIHVIIIYPTHFPLKKFLLKHFRIFFYYFGWLSILVY